MERKVLLDLLGVSDMKTDDIQYIDHQMHYSTAVSYLDNSVEEKSFLIHSVSDHEFSQWYVYVVHFCYKSDCSFVDLASTIIQRQILIFIEKTI